MVITTLQVSGVRDPVDKIRQKIVIIMVEEQSLGDKASVSAPHNFQRERERRRTLSIKVEYGSFVICSCIFTSSSFHQVSSQDVTVISSKIIRNLLRQPIQALALEFYARTMIVLFLYALG